MKTNLKENIFIEGFDDKIKFVAGHCFYNDNDQLFDVIYFGGTSEIPEEIAKECVKLTETSRGNLYQDYKDGRDYAHWIKDINKSILSACNQEFCIIYKTK